MLNSKAVDVVFLATPTALHADHGTQVLNHGKHLWCEKPLATNLADTQRMIDLAKSKGLCLTVVCAPLYHALFEAVHTQLADGQLGALESIHAAFRFPHIDADNFRYKPELGGGALLDVGFYLLSVIEALVPGDLMDLQSEIHTDGGYAVDTRGSATLAFETGSKAFVSWGYGFDYENCIEIKGEHGSISARPFFSKPQSHEIEAHVVSNTGHKIPILFEANDQFEQMISDFCRAMDNDMVRNRLMSFALRSQELLEQAALSGKDQP